MNNYTTPQQDRSGYQIATMDLWKLLEKEFTDIPHSRRLDLQLAMLKIEMERFSEKESKELLN